MRILVTGAAGYIGSHTVTLLLQNLENEVVALDNFSNSNPQTYHRVEKICGRKPFVIEHDLCQEAGLKEKLRPFEPFDGIIHFAALKSVPDSVKNPLLYYHNNMLGLFNILQWITSARSCPLIFSSSCSVYGNASQLPVTENSPVLPAESPYAHTKQMGEEVLHQFAQSFPQLKTVILRYFNPVGADPSGLNGEWPIQKPTNLIPIITQTAVGKNTLTVFGNDYPTRDGTCIRDYIHVYDIAEAHIQALQFIHSTEKSLKPPVFNLGSGNGTTVLEAISAFEKVSGIKLPYTLGPRRNGDVVQIFANNDKAQKLLGWKPKFSLEDMMRSAWKWQQTLEAQSDL